MATTQEVSRAKHSLRQECHSTRAALSGYPDGMSELVRPARRRMSKPLAGSFGRRTAFPSAVDIDATVHSAADALGALEDIERTVRSLELAKVRLIGTAQRYGASWDEIGAAMAVSRQAAWERYRGRVRELLDVTASRAGHSEEETLASAAAVLGEVRARRTRR
jgi:hypothetical protein